MTERDHLIACAQATGIAPPELQIPPIPASCKILWDVFLQLYGANSKGINFGEITHWQTLNDVVLNPWELDTILALDKVARKAAKKE